MNHSNNVQQNNRYNPKDFLPLIIIFALIIILSFLGQFFRQTQTFDLHLFMNHFMGFFFLIFGLFKIINLKNFAQAYSMYDLIAKRSQFYAYFYPFIEIFLGISYLLQLFPIFTNIFTLIVMLISATGVFIELKKGKHIVCACLGTVFKIPMTYVTLFEDLLMAVMAFIMLSVEIF